MSRRRARAAAQHEQQLAERRAHLDEALAPYGHAFLVANEEQPVLDLRDQPQQARREGRPIRIRRQQVGSRGTTD